MVIYSNNLAKFLLQSSTMKRIMKDILLKYGLLFIFFMGWSLKDVFTKLILGYIDPFQSSIIIATSAIIGSFFYIMTKKFFFQGVGLEINLTKQNRYRISILSLCTGSALYFTIVAIDVIGPLGYVITDVVAYPICVSILSFYIINEKISKGNLVSILISVGGLLIFYLFSIESNMTFRFTGVVSAIFSSFFYATSLVLIKDLLRLGFKPETIVFYRFFFLGLLIVFII